MRVLVLNPGSSTLKASVIETAGQRTVVERAATWSADAAGTERRSEVLARVASETMAPSISAGEIDAVGYRVVHGGTAFRAATLLDEAAIRAIDALDELAPLHNRIAAETIRGARSLRPEVPHVACFDTAFHATLDEAAWRYPVPADWHVRWGIRRFGFHGLSVDWSVSRAAGLLRRPATDLHVVVAHLGSGASVTAVAGGESVATSMGFTPLEGLMMGTRSGSIDPGILLFLIGHHVRVDELAEALAHRSGLLGVSGRSAGVEELLRLEAAGHANAALALELFARRAAAEIASVATALQRLDALVFTGGIGEHAASVRSRICRNLAVLGVPVPGPDVDIGDECLLVDSRPAIAVVHAREDLVIARQVEALLSGRAE